MKLILHLMLLLASTFLCSCGEPNLPSTPTVVTGNVVDENDVPLEGISLAFSGSRRASVSAISTFYIKTLTDKNGDFKLSYVVPGGTDFVTVQPIDNQVFSRFYYDIFIEKDGVYKLMASPSTIPFNSYGNTTNLNFQYRKR